MQHLIFHEIPDLDTVVEPENKQQRLQIMLVNLEKQRITVRNRILAAAQQTLGTLPRHHQPSDTPKPTSSPDIAHLLTSLAYTRSPPNTDEQAPPPPPPPPPSDCIPQVEPPAEVTLAVETLRQLKEHDERCKKAREPYERALERLVGHSVVQNGGANGEAGRRANGGAVSAATDPRRRPSGNGAGRV